MPSNKSNRSSRPSTTPGGPIRRDEDITAQEEALANDLPHQSSHQASPLTDDPREAHAHETRTGRAADEAAGLDPHRDQLPDAERAFRESRGSHEPRTKGYEKGKP